MPTTKRLRLRKGVVSVIIYLIVLVVLSGVALYAWSVYRNTSMQDIVWSVIAHDYKSATGSYGQGVTVQLGPVQDHITWDGKGVADIGFVGQHIKIMGQEYYFNEIFEMATKASGVPGWHFWPGAACYKVTLANTKHGVDYKYLKKNAYFRVNFNALNKLSDKVKNWIWSGYVSSNSISITTKPPVMLYIVHAHAQANFYKGSSGWWWSCENLNKISTKYLGFSHPLAVAG